jgi:hypothetical protein
MKWFAFLIYFLFSVCGAFVVWTVIRVGFRKPGTEKSVSPESPDQESARATNFDRRQHLYWNFTATLIVVPTLLLVLGITVETTSLVNPVTGTLAAALVLIWGMALWSGMLAFPDQLSDEHETETPFPPDTVTAKFAISQTTTDSKETP